MTALHWAAMDGCAEVVKVLLEKKPQIDAIDNVSQNMSVSFTLLYCTILYCVLLLLLLECVSAISFYFSYL